MLALPNAEGNRLVQQIPLVVRHVRLLTRTTEKLHTRSVIKQKENSAWKEVLAKRKRKGGGKRAGELINRRWIESHVFGLCGYNSSSGELLGPSNYER
jgi:hypothetical protein